MLQLTPFLKVYNLRYNDNTSHATDEISLSETPVLFARSVSKYFEGLKNKNQLDATYYFTVLLIGSTCFGHYYAHYQELATIMLITTLVVSFCKDWGGASLRTNVVINIIVASS